jgi:hypothetical protein
VRLIEYSTSSYNPAQSLQGAQTPTDLRYGEDIQLAGYTLPAGTEYASGSGLPISLTWVTDSKLGTDYTIAMSLFKDGVGVVSSAEDSQPYAGFAPTHIWQANQLIWDNRALRLPGNLPTGEYELWVGVYGFNESGEPELLNVSGTATAENNTIGVLPTVIIVR